MRRYFIASLSILLLALGAVGLFNHEVDPYGFWGRPASPGSIGGKPLVLAHVMTRKRMSFHGQQPEVVILGTSRAGQYSASHRAFAGSRAYNWHLPAAPIRVTANQLAFAHASGRLKQAVVVLDFFAFNAYIRTPPGMEDGSPLAGRKYDLLLNFTTFRDSLRTIKARRARDGERAKVQAARAESAARPGNFLLAGPARHPLRDLFVETEEGFAKNVYFPRPHRKFSFRDQASGYDALDDFRRLVSYAYGASGLELKLIIGPSHARLWEVLHATGLWAPWEDWKRELVRINEEEAGKAGRAAFGLWDFSGYNRITTEEVPRDRDDSRRTMTFFLESSHYNARAAASVLDVVYALDRGDGLGEGGFGTRLTGATVEAQLRAICRARQRYVAGHPGDVAEVRETVRRARRYDPNPRSCR